MLNEKNLIGVLRVVNAGRSVVMNAVGGCRRDLLNLGSGMRRPSVVATVRRGRGLTSGSVVQVLRSVLLPRLNASVNAEKKVSVPKIVVVALGQILGSWIGNVRVVAGIVAAQRGGARGLRGSSAVGRLAQQTGSGSVTRKRFVAVTGEREREPTLGSWIVSAQNVVNVGDGGVRNVVALWRKRPKGLGGGMRNQFVVGIVNKVREPTLAFWNASVKPDDSDALSVARSVAVVWQRQLKGLGSGTRKQFVVGTDEKEREPTSRFWNVNVKPVRMPVLSGNWIDKRFVISVGNGFVAGLKRSESAKKQRSG